MSKTEETIASFFKEENIKYDEKMLEKVTDMAEKVYKDKIKYSKPMLEHGIGVAREVAHLRLRRGICICCSFARKY
ncbi:MAG: hypothetical protein RSE00_05370 [Clostridia bacterium]